MKNGEGQYGNWRVAVIPTDTVYGIVARVGDRDAIDRLYAIRNREIEKGCIVLLSNIAELEKWQDYVSIPEFHREYVESHWPGPCTFEILEQVPLRNHPPELYRGGQASSFRVPDDPWLRAFIHEHGPIIAPSANPAGMPPATTCAMAREYFGDSVDMYIDRGERDNKPSKIISLLGDEIEIIRE